MFQKEARQGIGAEEKNSNTEWEFAGWGGADTGPTCFPKGPWGGAAEGGTLPKDPAANIPPPALPPSGSPRRPTPPA